MAAIQANGSGSVTSSSTNNNGGSVLSGGTTSYLNTVALGYSDVGVFGTTPVDNNTADKALSSGTFAYNNLSPIAPKVTDTIAGVASDVLATSANRPSLTRSIHRQEKVRTRRLTTAIRAGYWNIYSGLWTTNPTNAVDNFWDNAGDTTSSTSTDQAASPSRSNPGELTYKTGAKVPVNDDYKAKTN
jgi:hypothetical protein